MPATIGKLASDVPTSAMTRSWPVSTTITAVVDTSSNELNFRPAANHRSPSCQLTSGSLLWTSERRTVVLILANAAAGQDAAFEGALLRDGLAGLADLRGVISAELLTLADEQIRGSAKKYAYGVLVELHDEGEALASLADRIPALPHLDRERWLAVVFRPIGHRLTTAEARAARHG